MMMKKYGYSKEKFLGKSMDRPVFNNKEQKWETRNKMWSNSSEGQGQNEQAM